MLVRRRVGLPHEGQNFLLESLHILDVSGGKRGNTSRLEIRRLRPSTIAHIAVNARHNLGWRRYKLT